MWSIDNGQKIKTLPELHGQAEITAMDFDDSNTKFFTASTDGTIKIWDFSGHCYFSLELSQNNEILQVLTLKRRIIAVGASKYAMMQKI
jgi:WD40 repeat protein